MKKITNLCFITMLIFNLFGCINNEVIYEKQIYEVENMVDEMMIYAHINEEVLEIKLEDNSSTAALVELLKTSDLTCDMSDYGGFEKVGSLNTGLPKNDVSITTEPGDVILYQGNKITIYYGVNSWSFTRLGKVVDLSKEELMDILGEGDVRVRFSLSK